MKAWLVLPAMALASVAGPALCQAVEHTDAISRRVVFVVPEPSMRTDAVSRRLLFTNAFHDNITDASSRQVMGELAAYSAADAQRALAIAAGLVAGSESGLGRLNVIRDGASATTVDMRDAVRIVRMAMGLDR